MLMCFASLFTVRKERKGGKKEGRKGRREGGRKEGGRKEGRKLVKYPSLEE